jgi:coenzyme F420-reducing hydrogenase alpha subunit
MADKIKELLHVNYHKGKNEYIWLSHKRALRHDQKTKLNNSQWGKRNEIKGQGKPIQQNHSRKFPNSMQWYVYPHIWGISDSKKKWSEKNSHFIIQIPKLENKEMIQKWNKEKRLLTYKDKHILITSEHWAQTLKSRKACSNIIQALR